jgi:hypothetical protein
VSGGSNIEEQSFGVSFTVTATYGIELNQTGPLVFDEAIFGYPAQEPQPISIRNTGNQPTGSLTLSVSNGDFTLDPPSTAASIDVGKSGSFTVVPNIGLAEGTHTALVTVSGGSNIEAQSFGVSFAVKPAPSYLRLTDGTTVEFGAGDLDALCSDSGADASITVGGQTVVKNTITKVAIGSAFAGVTALPDGFCANFSNLTELDLIGFTSLTSIGIDFLGYCASFNQHVTIPASVTTIGQGLMAGCTVFNQPLELPEGVTSIGPYFLYQCAAFNSPLTLPATVTSLGDNFMWGCGTFNHPIDIPSGITTIGVSFMSRCAAFDQPLKIPEGVTSIAQFFLYQCDSFNSQITFPSTLTFIDYQFMYRCYAFDKPIILPEGLTTIGSRFMMTCTLFNSELRLPSTLTSIGIYPLCHLTSFNQPLTIPSSLTSIGEEFLYDCQSMVSTITINCPATAFAASAWTFATENRSANCITTGIKIAGPSAAEIMARFTNSDFRNLIAAQ